MSADLTKPAPVSGALLWTGRALTALPALLLTMSAVMKLTGAKEVSDGMGKLGWESNLALPLGITELVCTILYVIPQTSVLGAILLTGYLGGATATHLRVGDPFIMPIVIGVVIWFGIYLREPRLWKLVPWRS